MSKEFLNEISLKRLLEKIRDKLGEYAKKSEVKNLKRITNAEEGSWTSDAIGYPQTDVYLTKEDGSQIIFSMLEPYTTKSMVDDAGKVLTSKIEEVSAIAKGRATGLVFDNFDGMDAWMQSPAHKNYLQQGDNLYIKDTGVPDYWVCSVLEEPDAETGYYYEIAPLETQKVDLDEYVKNTDYATGEKGGVVKINNSSSGLKVDSNGVLSIKQATKSIIDSKISQTYPITPYVLDYAVQSCTNQDLDAELTEEQLKLPPSTQAFKAAIGDIDTALDSILAIQNSYI